MKKSVKGIRMSTKLIGKTAEYSIKGAGKVLGTAVKVTKKEGLSRNTEKVFNVVGEGVGKSAEITGIALGYAVDKAVDVASKKRTKHKKNFIVVSSKEL